MQQETLSALLASITGNLYATTLEEELQLDNLHDQLAQTLQHQTIETTANQRFAFESSDFFFSQNIKGNRLEKIDEKVKNVLSNKLNNDLKVFVRETPIRSSQVAGSVAEWAGGARVLATIGPLRGRDGRLKWFDFFKVEKLVAIYFNGQPQPAILFNASFNVRKIIGPPLPPEITKLYNVISGSVWVNAKLLSNDAPANRYCGIRVKGGTIKLNEIPLLINGRLTIPNTSSMKIDLQMDQPKANETTAPDAHGADARALKIKLPTQFSFTLTNISRSIQVLDPLQWVVYGQEGKSSWAGNQQTLFDGFTNRVLIAVNTEPTSFTIKSCLSPFNKVSGTAKIKNTWWGLPTAIIDTTKTVEADGNGAMVFLFDKGFNAERKAITGADTSLPNPVLIAEPGRIGITDLKSNSLGSTQQIELWKDEKNPHGTTAALTFLNDAAWIYNSLSNGFEVLLTMCNADIQTDRPVKVNGEPLQVNTKNSVALFAANAKNNALMLYDDNIIFDNTKPSVFNKQDIKPKPIAIALENALFTTTTVNGCLLIADCSKDWQKAVYAKLFLTVGLYAYLPTLPDPYAANLNFLKRQYVRGKGNDTAGATNQNIWLWLVCRISSKPNPDVANIEKYDAVKTSFHFGNLPFDEAENTDASRRVDVNKTVTDNNTLRSRVGADMLNTSNIRAAMFNVTAGESGAEEIKALSSKLASTSDIKNYEKIWDDTFGNQLTDAFALLDVSSNANQMGISFGMFGNKRMAMMPTGTVAITHTDTTVNNALPFLVQDMSVLSSAMFVRAFTLPQVAWEPVFNLSAKVQPMDPDLLFNYYPNDGGPTRLFNFSAKPVPLAPIPVTKFLVDEFKKTPKSYTMSNFTLPFGMRAFGAMSLDGKEIIKPSLENNSPDFTKYKGGIQLSVKAGNHGYNFPTEPSLNDSPMLTGFTLQLNNILKYDGTPNSTSTLAQQPTQIFNGEFFNLSKERGVPVPRIDISGYGANMFSNWVSPSAAFAATSQARFDVMLGRTAHEVVQVKSVLYPWGIRVVRTITLQRESSGYIYRQDSGWQAESDGLFDFRYRVNPTDVNFETPYILHPGLVTGLFNVKNITIDGSIQPFKEGLAHCDAVFFDADVEIENVVIGKITAKDKSGKNHTSCVPSKRILGYVQIAPTGVPIKKEEFRNLLNAQNGSIGGQVDCEVDVNKTSQHMRINRFDVSASTDKTGQIIFVAAARGNVLLPKDGSWSIVQHSTSTGDVTPLSESLTVPLIREGIWIPEKVIDVAKTKDFLVRMAHPKELLRNVAADTINFGILQNMGTQKALFLTPSFKVAEQTLLSKTPPIFADAYRMMTGKGIFPNIGDAVTDFGKAFSLKGGVDAVGNAVSNAFEVLGGLQDGGKDVFKLLKIDPIKQGEVIVEQGMALAKKAATFNVPDFNVPLVDMEGLKIYIEYKTSKVDKNNTENDAPGTKKESKLNFDIASKAAAAANEVAETWKGRMNDLSMVVDLGTFKRLMRIKGNFDAAKGKAAGYGGDTNGGGGLPTPEIEFHPALQPIIDLLQVLADLSSGDYGAALKKGLKVAMGNAGEIWEYKFEATKEIPLVRFPPLKEAYDNPATPLKLEASMALGVYFNAALKVTSDPSQLLPTAGAFLKFHGGLSVMCVSVGVGTIYAVGSVDVKIACDTAVGPNLTLQFGFGASITVGLPVVGNATVTFMVGVEMYADSKEISITAFMLFRGHAELLGGLVGVTITIEAKGTVKRIGNRTDCSAQVTFAIDISIFLIIDISFSETWGEERQVA